MFGNWEWKIANVYDLTIDTCYRAIERRIRFANSEETLINLESTSKRTSRGKEADVSFTPWNELLFAVKLIRFSRIKLSAPDIFATVTTLFSCLGLLYFGFGIIVR
ncbi:15475_t:CDS:2 [Funneliformis mosseae]|uniref:15475_t:CDS:1 n=1 Tax=Funneliformis mosseae TaxID=27381 RepID=A0A9N9BNJ8_FUNMO|nr:15475_t:CDS:2 [Funneliformis mosseae]